MTKKELRKEIRWKRSLLSEEEIQAMSREICGKIESCSMYKAADFIFAYIPLMGEVDLWPLINAAYKDKKHVAVPRVSGMGMEFYEIGNAADLKPGYMGILEPKDYCAEADSRNALMIMPGTAFDVKMHRCGYGGGFYDRYLEINPDIRRIAAAFDFQIYDEIPYEKTDIKPDIIVTEKRIIE